MRLKKWIDYVPLPWTVLVSVTDIYPAEKNSWKSFRWIQSGFYKKGASKTFWFSNNKFSVIWVLNVAPLQIQKCVHGLYRTQQKERSLWKLLTSTGILHIQNEQGEKNSLKLPSVSCFNAGFRDFLFRFLGWTELKSLNLLSFGSLMMFGHQLNPDDCRLILWFCPGLKEFG